MKSHARCPIALILVMVLSALIAAEPQARAQKEMPEVNILTAVGNLAFAAVWVADELKYFEAEARWPRLRADPSACLPWLEGRQLSAHPPRKGWSWQTLKGCR